ncbi:hypothetical protein FLONG3_10795 [Fusarium longipes]|uniref:Uncharacterized protein n=1 Tax=Fusarium longipes TaxID=694270 RepID=A0A395RKL3_9HYPO|nr:hypothetical protein FLONG3_10795 [Fusarium longipes]
MGSHRTGLQHYLEPLAFRRPAFDRPLFFSEQCDRGHRPPPFDISGISNFFSPKLKSTGTLWKELLAELSRMAPPGSALLGSALLGPEASSEPLKSPIDRFAVNVFKQWNSKRARDEFGFVDVSPVSDRGPLLSSISVSPLEESLASAATSLLFGYRDNRAMAARPDILVMLEQGELGPYSVYDFSDDSSLSWGSSSSPDSPWREGLASPPIADNMSIMVHEATTPRLFLGDLSLLNRATGEYEYQSPTFTSTGYGAFIMNMPFTPRSPTSSDYSETDNLLLPRNDVMDEYLGDEDFCVWDVLFLCIGVLLLLGTYASSMLVCLKYLAGV